MGLSPTNTAKYGLLKSTNVKFLNQNCDKDKFVELWICILVPNLSTPHNETCAKKLDFTAPQFSPSVNKKKVWQCWRQCKEMDA